ncbi:GTP-dependent nucleic acid-binding protein EngD [Clostridium aceticum]|uniref:Ribosome-binding ATPase YchF n=1 Tax=Clostridium aceticum TaxID=84022 RepID=A0A0D8IHC0_9CLOT|nr:redox-regulated ATPase YchF [Clostridium aceticum]AKL94049.1 GTP-dependent nucleic acid-binding protein EngD [Clostridium aceticum]KJF28581.1 GTP-binding protein [Clostridium aceticum]
MKLGIVGLPNVGKSTLFNAITQAGAESANYPFCTIEPNVGVVAVPDDRLKFLTDLYQSEKTIPAAIEFYDIAGLVRGASKGEGLGNKFLSHIREVASILQVVRCFEDSNITHVEGSVNPLRDIETINLELVFSDLEMVEKRLQKSEKLVKGDKSLLAEVDLLKKIHSTLEEGLSARSLEYDEKELEILKTFNLLSMKPIIYIANVAEHEVSNEGADNPYVQQLRGFAKTEGAEVVVICAKIEAEISELEEEEKAMFLEELGLSQSGLDRLVQASYSLLGLISYLTAGPKEVRAWTIKNGTKAPQAAGKIHSDFERGFIRAEIVAFDDLVNCGTYAAAKEKGLVRLEGKEYVVQDGDVILFRFNV